MQNNMKRGKGSYPTLVTLGQVTVTSAIRGRKPRAGSCETNWFAASLQAAEETNDGNAGLYLCTKMTQN
jgi:hypothetical protein